MADADRVTKKLQHNFSCRPTTATSSATRTIKAPGYLQGAASQKARTGCVAVAVEALHLHN